MTLLLAMLLSTNNTVCFAPIDISKSHISSRYGKRTFKKGKVINGHMIMLNHDHHSFHLGVDIVAKKGTHVKNQFRGRVIKTYKSDRNGSYVRIEHSDKEHDTIQVLYHHLDKIFVKEDSWIYPGELIGTVGDTGTDHYPHLHLSARYFSYSTRQKKDINIEEVFKFCNYEYRHHDYAR